MIPPKTDWTRNDYYNLADHNRIRENLNDSKVRGGKPINYDLMLPHSVGDELYYGERTHITDHYNSLAANMGWQDFPKIALSYNWFNWQELNLLEGLCEAVNGRYDDYARYGSGPPYGAGNTLGGGYFG